MHLQLSGVKYWAGNVYCQSAIVNDEKEATFIFIFKEEGKDLTENV